MAKSKTRRQADPSEDGGLEALKADPRNARKHGDRNLSLIQTAMETVGAGRSIVIDETATVLAGNGAVEAARRAGMKLRIVDTDRHTLIAVRRTDLSADEKTRLALLDNRTGELAEWDSDAEEEPDGGLLTRRELANRLSVHMMTVTGWEQDGMPIAQRGGRGRPSLYDEAAVREWRRLRDDSAGHAAGPSSPGLVVAMERARKLRLENDARERRLVPLDHAKREAFQSMRMVRESMLNIPSRLSGELAAEMDAAAIFRKLDAAIREALASTADALEATIH